MGNDTSLYTSIVSNGETYANGFTFSDYDGGVKYGISYITDDDFKNVTNKTGEYDILFVGYSNAKKKFGQYGRSGSSDRGYTYAWVDVHAYQQFTISEDYQPDEGEDFVSWFTENTTKQ